MKEEVVLPAMDLPRRMGVQNIRTGAVPSIRRREKLLLLGKRKEYFPLWRKKDEDRKEEVEIPSLFSAQRTFTGFKIPLKPLSGH